MNISNHKNTILIIIAVLLAFFGYWFFFLSKKDATPKANKNGSLTAQAPVATAKTSYDKEFVTSLLGLNSVNLDVSIFQSNVYQALSYPEVPFVVNYTRETGRDNPFLPIGVDFNKSQTVQAQVNANTAPNPTVQSPTNNVSASTSTTPAKATSTAPVIPKPKTF